MLVSETAVKKGQNKTKVQLTRNIWKLFKKQLRIL